ncbi:MAG: endolytic transglycosylase MltG [Bacteroidales bacterium]|nr:endolytic transglycosylase MltG [Bacteroidales bacterium]
MKITPRLKKILLGAGCALLVLAALGGSIAWRYYLTYHRPNVGHTEHPIYIYVPAEATFGRLMDSLTPHLRNPKAFVRAAHKEQLPERLKGGRYQLKEEMNNKAIVRMFALGWQTPVHLVIAGNIRSAEKLAAVLSRPLETDSLSMLLALKDSSIIGAMGFDSVSLFSLVLPNTYEVYWNTLPDKLIERLYKEYNAFWNEERRGKAASTGLSLLQVSTLASIIYEETKYQPEMPTIAGVYMNRLRIGMPLQADPTLIFALGDPSIRRVLNRDRLVDSPYNTYKHRGLPPGPICVPSLATLEAVLNYQSHNYLYFCASSDFNGSHLFAANYSDHLRNARAYHQALNQRGIRR